PKVASSVWFVFIDCEWPIATPIAIRAITHDNCAHRLLFIFLFMVICRAAGQRYLKKSFPPASQSVPSKCSPGGNSANFSRCSGRSGSEMACSSLNHFPRSTSLHRREQKGPQDPANQSPVRPHVGHLTLRIFSIQKPNTVFAPLPM